MLLFHYFNYKNSRDFSEKAPAADRRKPMGKENREHKDSVFVDLFYEDETAKENLLSL